MDNILAVPDDLAKKGWRIDRCGSCRGYGLYEVWEGFADCKHCNSGFVYVTPRGRHVLYPGGPFC